MLRLITMNMLLGGALGLGGCATPEAPASAAAAGANGVRVASNDQEKVCRREIVTGALMPKTVCRTRAEWARLSSEAEANKDRALERSNQSRRPGT